MSWQASRWAIQTRGHKGASKLVLMALACYHNIEEGRAVWAYRSKLAGDAELGLTTVSRAISHLVRLGLVAIEGGGGGGRATTYKLNIDSKYYDSPELVTSAPTLNGVRPESIPEPVAPQIPAWLTALKKDKRWPDMDESEEAAYVEAIQQDYGHLALDSLAQNCYDWLQHGKGLRRKRIKAVWASFLTRASSDYAEGRKNSEQTRQTHGDVEKYLQSDTSRRGAKPPAR